MMRGHADGAQRNALKRPRPAVMKHWGRKVEAFP